MVEITDAEYIDQCLKSIASCERHIAACERYIAACEKRIVSQDQTIDRLTAIAATTIEDIERKAVERVLEKFGAKPDDDEQQTRLN
jgi:hypothetical protein